MRCVAWSVTACLAEIHVILDGSKTEINISIDVPIIIFSNSEMSVLDFYAIQLLFMSRMSLPVLYSVYVFEESIIGYSTGRHYSVGFTKKNKNIK